MLRFLLRAFVMLLLFVMGRLLGPGARKGGRFDSPSRGPGGSPGAGGSGDRGRAPRGAPPLDRSDAVDVPYTEIPPPPGPAAGAAGES